MKCNFAKCLLAVICGGLFFTGSAAFAQEEQTPEKTPEQMAAERFKVADTNDDGSITREEFRAYITSKLDWFTMVDEFMNRLDTDKDNKISPAEFLNRQKVILRIVEEEDAKAAEKEAAKNRSMEFQDVFNAKFMPNNPTVGSLVDGVEAFDETGKQLKLEDLRGKHVVINFGCLT